MIALALSGCELVDNTTTTAVDAATLPPLTSRERSLIFAADGAAQQGNYAAAERDYLTAVADSKGHVEAHLALARLYGNQHQPSKELTILQRATELQPDHPLANYLLGKLYLEGYQYDEALAAFRRGLKTRPDDIDLSVGEAIANDMQGKHSAAQLIYLRTIKVNPDANLGNIHTNLAMSYLLSDQPKKAIELLQPEAKKPNTSSVTRHNLALAYGLLGRHPDAKKVLNGEMDEESRLLAIARLKEYLREQDDNKPPLTPTIKESPSTTDEPSKKPAKKSTAPAKPQAAEPTADKASATTSKAAPVEKVSSKPAEISKAKPPATEPNTAAKPSAEPKPKTP
jgi:Flp pilus assembly protein TadD